MLAFISFLIGLFLFNPPTIEEPVPNPINMEDGVYTASLDKSQIKWKAYKVTGQHDGIVNLSSGELVIKNNEIVGGNFVADMTSITVQDLTGESKGKLEGHLKSPDFFGVEEYPKAKFEITDAFPIGENGEYRIKGDLTIKENTNPIAFRAQMSEDGKMIKAEAEFKIDRSKYNVRYGSGSFFDNLGDKTIYDEFDLAINLVVSK
jgi:polyisoprenoid-binding protein YceI